jgi:hypothetical protein
MRLIVTPGDIRRVFDSDRMRARPAISGNGVTYGSPPATRPVAEARSCAVYDSGHDVRIMVTSARRSECSALAASLSRGGDFWTAQPQATSDPLQPAGAVPGESAGKIIAGVRRLLSADTEYQLAHDTPLTRFSGWADAYRAAGRELADLNARGHLHRGCATFSPIT